MRWSRFVVPRLHLTAKEQAHAHRRKRRGVVNGVRFEHRSR